MRALEYPEYRFPRGLAVEVAFSAALKRRRDFRRDARRCIEALDPPARVLGEENIPQAGPCLLVMNHYYRPGFRVWWLSMAISARLPMPHAWMITSKWTAPGKWYEPVKEAYSSIVSRRLEAMYGFLRMPPMPPREKEVEERAASVRAALRYMERTPQAVLCLAPEGHDILSGMLERPPAGLGRFIALLAAGGLPIFPAGGWEQDGRLTVRFGEAFCLETGRGGGAEERDRRTTDAVMERIAALLPDRMRGEFG